MSTTRKFFSGDSIEQAVLQAARHHGIDPDELSYSVIEKRHGFLKVRRRVLIEVPPDAPRKGDAPSRQETPAVEKLPAPPPQLEVPARPLEPRPSEGRAASPTEEAESAQSESAAPPAREESEQVLFHEISSGERPRPLEPFAPPQEPSSAPPSAETPVNPPAAVPAGEMVAAAYKALDHLFALGDLRLEADVTEGAEGLEVEIHGDDQDVLLRDRGRLLLAIQHLLPRLLRGLTGDSVPVQVDSDNFHEIREERLRDLAQRAASDVLQGGRARTLEPMSPDERRIVHLTLTDDAGVTTESKGQGFFKRITVRPKRGARR